MRIVELCAGLGNQIYMYVFGRYLEEITGEPVVYDDAGFFSSLVMHNGYELEAVFPNIKKPTLLSQCFSDKVWTYMLQQARASKMQSAGIAEHLFHHGLDNLKLCLEPTDARNPCVEKFSGEVITTPLGRYNSAIAKIPGNVYYWGHWVNPGWINPIKDKIIKELAFPPIESMRNKNYERLIKGSFSIGIHIRRGDFVKLNRAMPHEYYNEIITTLKEKCPMGKFFVFSNDMEWCKENSDELGLPRQDTHFVEGNFDFKNNYIDIQLMAMCNVLIISPSSTFSLVAAMLNQEKEFFSVDVSNYPDNDVAEETK